MATDISLTVYRFVDSHFFTIVTCSTRFRHVYVKFLSPPSLNPSLPFLPGCMSDPGTDGPGTVVTPCFHQQSFAHVCRGCVVCSVNTDMGACSSSSSSLRWSERDDNNGLFVNDRPRCCRITCRSSSVHPGIVLLQVRQCR